MDNIDNQVTNEEVINEYLYEEETIVLDNSLHEY